MAVNPDIASFLRAIEMTDALLSQGLQGIGLGLFLLNVGPPPMAPPLRFEFPASSGNFYQVMVTQPHADAIQKAVNHFTTEDQLFDYLAALRAWQTTRMQEVAPIIYDALNGAPYLPFRATAKTAKKRSNVRPLAGGTVVLGCCLLTTGKKLEDLSEPCCAALTKYQNWYKGACDQEDGDKSQKALKARTRRGGRGT
jgi:hypothetical protein